MTTATESKRVKVLNRKLIPIARLKDAPYNPPRRIEAKRLGELADSMDLIGLLHPITVTPANEIVDGHRRRAAAKQLGWADIECNVVDEDRDTVYRTVNVTSRRISGNEALVIWLKHQNATPIKLHHKFTGMLAAIGIILVRKIADAGLSYSTFDVAQRIARYCGRNRDLEFLKQSTRWLLDTTRSGIIHKAMQDGEDPKVILKAVLENKPVKFRLSVQE